MIIDYKLTYPSGIPTVVLINCCQDSIFSYLCMEHENQRLSGFLLFDAGLPSASTESPLLLVLHTPSVAGLGFVD